MKKSNGYLVCRLIAVFLLATLAAEATVARGNLRVEANWSDLPGTEATLRLSTGGLRLTVRNLEPVDIAARITWRLNHNPGGGGLDLTLRPLEIRQISLPLTASVLTAESQRYSGRLQAEISCTAAGSRLRTSAGLPALFYHPVTGGVLVYGGSVLRAKFGAGNYRGEPMDVNGPMARFRRALIDLRAPAADPVVARVFRPHVPVSGQTGVPGNGRRFCLVMPGWPYQDSSHGEDLGTIGQSIPLARSWVVVSQAGNPLFTGFLDTTGCTPHVAAAGNAPTLMVFSPLYYEGASNLRGFVSDLNLGRAWPATMPLYFLNFDSENGTTTTVQADTSDYVQTIFAAAVQGLERFPGGATNTVYEWQLRQEGDNSGTLTDYAAEGHTVTHIKYSTAALEKFTVVHEYGHAVLLSKLNPQFGPGDLDYSVTNGEGEQHTLESKEWQLAAALEGFAHFVAAVAWNDVSAAPGAFYVDVSTPYDLSALDRFFESNWNAADFAGQGVERDWAQFFWNYYTDPPAFAGVSTPSQATLVAIWRAAYPWPKQQGFFADLAAGAAAVLAEPLPNLPIHWFLAVAGMAGVDH